MRLWFGGDVHLGDAGFPTLPLQGAGVVNLEGPIGDGAFSPERLVNAPSVPAALAAAGVRVAWVENNHAADDGPDGRERTVAALEHAGIAPAGATVVTVQGLKVAFLGVDLQKGVMAADVAAARALGDVLVVGFHVTALPLLLPPPELEVAVPLALQHGASVVVVHGSHALARVERKGDAVIAWGLGNLAFACPCSTEKDGLALEVELDAVGHVVAAWAVPVAAGLGAAAPALSAQPGLIFDLLESLASSPLTRDGPRARF